LQENNITRYSTYSEHKSAVVERFNRTLKEMMWKKFTAENTRNWIDMLEDLLKKYNNNFHNTIGMTPAKASKEEMAEKVLENILTKTSGSTSSTTSGSATSSRSVPARRPKFKVGDKVRISRTKALFEKGYLPNWSEELYIIEKVRQTIPITYKLTDLLGEKIEGSFYTGELQKSVQEVYRVEKVIRKKKIKGIEYALVKWTGYSEKHNQWIPTKELDKLI